MPGLRIAFSRELSSVSHSHPGARVAVGLGCIPMEASLPSAAPGNQGEAASRTTRSLAVPLEAGCIVCLADGPRAAVQPRGKRWARVESPGSGAHSAPM